MNLETSEFWLQTYSGLAFDFMDPKPEQICLKDIVHSLAGLCRYGGHSRFFYSVAQHSVLASLYLEEQGQDKQVQFAGLMHDAAEAYVGDLPTPLKRLLGESYKRIYKPIERAICAKYNLPSTIFDIEAIKEADMQLLADEKAVLHVPEPQPWRPMPEPRGSCHEFVTLITVEHAEELFRNRFLELV